jgi:hypothetical protein
VSLDELEEFMNPDKLTRNDVSSVDRILLKFKSIQSNKEDISQELGCSFGDKPKKYNGDQNLQISDELSIVGDYCMKMISEINGSMGGE